jgi:Dolichyl-phosphate-mannose-protein mannosyltransferase
MLAVVVVAGAALRLYQISGRSMTHVEMFVPGIPLRADLSVPKPRMDLWTVVTSTLSSDTHPPGYYVLMWMVTKCFGSSTLAIRLPSVIFGVGSIGLVFWLGMLIGQRGAACVAAALLAFNGYHIVWSKTGRMYSMGCFLALLTTILLLLLARSTRPRRFLEIGYAALVLLSLSTHYFLWAVLATQMLWVLGNAWVQNRPLPRLLNIQILVAILGSPLVAFAAYQSGNPVANLSRDVPRMAMEYIQFVYLLPGSDDTYSMGGTAGFLLGPQFLLLRVLLFVFCVVLLIAGLRRLKSVPEPLLGEATGSFIWPWLLAAAVAMITIALHVVVAGHQGDHKPTLKYTKALIVLPPLMALGAITLSKTWSRLRAWFAGWNLQFLSGGPPLVWLLAVTPFVLLGAVSVLFRPIMDARGLLYLSPFLLLTLASGIVSLGSRSRVMAISLFLIVGVLHAYSVAAYRDRIVGPINFREFADRLKPRVRGNDLVFLRHDWDTTPILYYLRSDQYDVRAHDFSDAVRRDPDARVWTLLLHGETIPSTMKQALEEYHEVETVDIPLARGVLYCRSACQ